MNKKIFSNIFLCYLCLAPINWLPLLPVELVNGIKYVLFVLLLTGCLAKDTPHQKVSFFFSLPFYVLVLLCELPAILQSDADVVTNIVDISFLFLMNYVIIQSNLTKDELFKIFYKAAIFIGFICLLSIASALSGVTIKSPPPWEDPFSSSALGGYRTGWSNSIFLFVPFLFYAYFFSGEKKWKLFSLIAIFAIVGSQILSGGRAGLIGSLFTFLFFTRFKIRNIIVLAVVVIFVYNSLGTEKIEEYFRASESQIENKQGTSILDKISSGRFGVYEIGWQLFKKSPVTGNGFSATTKYTDGPDVHNTWFKRLVDGGIIFVIPLVLLFIGVYRKAIEKTSRYYNGDKHRILFRALFFSALFISMFEPNYLIGSFQGEAFFWALACTYLK